MLLGQDAQYIQTDIRERLRFLSSRHRVVRLEKRLNEAVSSAIRGVPFYRSRLAEAVNGLERPLSLEALKCLPCVTRQDVIDHEVDLCTDDIAQRRFFRHRTSGTTGCALSCYVEVNDWLRNLVSIAFQLEILGLNVLSPSIGQWSFLQIPSRVRGPTSELVTPLPNRPIWKRFNMPVSDDGTCEAASLLALNEALSCCLTVVNSLPSVLLKIGRRRSAMRVRAQPAMIISSGEVLQEAHRDELQQLFECPVFNCYAASEVGTIAFECRLKDGLHVDEERVIVEIEEGNRTRGEVIVTSLWNEAMPMLRYRTGDSAVLIETPCTCGDTRPRLAHISRDSS